MSYYSDPECKIWVAVPALVDPDPDPTLQKNPDPDPESNLKLHWSIKRTV